MSARTVLVLALLLVLAGCSGSIPTAAPGPAGGAGAGGAHDLGAGSVHVHVEHVVDGDTIDISYANGTADTVRMVGIDTPETHAKNTPGEYPGVPNTTAGAACLGRWGENASAFAHRKLEGRDVTLVFDPNTDRRGYYGRLLAYVYLGNDSYDYDTVSQGFARVYEHSDFSKKSAYETAARDARSSHKGLWACQTPTNRSDNGSAGGSTTTAGDTASLSIRVHADAAGPDGSNLDDEYVVLTNGGSTVLSMGNWTLSDAAHHTYEFPENATLDAGASVTVHTGSGTDNATDRYWGAGDPVWNNDGDTVTVRAANGTRIARHDY